MESENIYYNKYKKYLEDSELYLSNISMWEIIYFYYLNNYLSFIIKKINETKKKIIYIIAEKQYSDFEVLINLIKKYKKNSILVYFEKTYEGITFYKIKKKINSYSKSKSEIELDLKKIAKNNYNIIYLKKYGDKYNFDEIINICKDLQNNTPSKINEVNYKNYKNVNYDKINSINFNDIINNIILLIRGKMNYEFIKKIVKITDNNYYSLNRYGVTENFEYVDENKYETIFDLINLININEDFFIKIHKERKDYLNKYFGEFKINVNWDEFKKINLYARDYYRFLTSEQIYFFIFNVKRCVKKLNNLSKDNKKYILVPGDSVSKIVLYIEKLNLCPQCEFIMFPLSSTSKNKNKNTINYIESFIPNDFSNLIIMDFILSGNSLKVIIEALESKLNKYPTEKNKLTFKKIKHDFKIIFSEYRYKGPYKLEENNELKNELINELNNYDNFDSDDKILIENIIKKKKYTSNYIIDPIVKYDDMDGYNPLSIDGFARCVPTNLKHIKVKNEEYEKIKYDCDIIQYILVVNGVNEEYFKTFTKLYYYFFCC